MPSNRDRENIKENLEVLDLMGFSNSNRDQESQSSNAYQEKYRVAVSKNYKAVFRTDTIPQETLAAVCYYAEQKQVPVVGSELPEISFATHLAFKYTRTQLESILTTSAREISYHPNEICRTPFKFAK